MASKRGEVGKKRREQVVEAAVAIIAEKGLPDLSLSKIEKRTGMSRGQLTYYFKTKEDILLAVFDRMIDMMHQQDRRGEVWDGHKLPPQGWERLHAFLTLFLMHPPNTPEFPALQYTFLSQVGHRDDFRARLADLYEGWRQNLAADVHGELTASGKAHVSARTLATFIQAVLHGLTMQREADPAAFDPAEMLTLFQDLLGGFLTRPTPPTPRRGRRIPQAGDA